MSRRVVLNSLCQSAQRIHVMRESAEPYDNAQSGLIGKAQTRLHFPGRQEPTHNPWIR